MVKNKKQTPVDKEEFIEQIKSILEKYSASYILYIPTIGPIVNIETKEGELVILDIAKHQIDINKRISEREIDEVLFEEKMPSKRRPFYTN